MSFPWKLGDGSNTVATPQLRQEFIYDQLNQKLALAGIIDQTTFSAFAQYLGYSSAGGSANIVTTPAGLDPLIGVFTFGDITGLTKLVINATTSLAGYDIEDTTTLRELDFPNLVSIDPTNVQDGFFSCLGNAALTTLSIPLLATVTGELQCNSNCVLTAFSAPKLTHVGNNLNCNSNDLLASISLPVLNTLVGFLQCNANPVLTTVSVPLWTVTDGSIVTFNGCSLNAASVQLILRRCVVSGVTTCSIDLSGGANAGTASLNAQGQADVATLGAQVTMNP